MTIKKLSKKSQAMVEADRLGFHCHESGAIFDPQGDPVYLFDDAGYKAFKVKLDTVWINVRVHRFIAYQRFGDIALSEDLVVRHQDNDKSNNTWRNLLLGSHRENYMDLPKQERSERARNAVRARYAA